MECVFENDGGYPFPNVFDLEDCGGQVFNDFLSFNVDSPVYILKVYYAVIERLPKKVVPFADDPFSNFLCFDYRNSETPTIVFSDQEIAYENIEVAIIPICNTFSELLNNLYLEEE